MWGRLPWEVVQDICRLSDSRGVHTSLRWPTGVAPDVADRCPFAKVKWPVDRVRWCSAAVAARPSHITLGEADAANWALEDRLHRPAEFDCKVLHGGDSMAAAGAFNKGRSSSWPLNQRCRRRCAICLAGGFEDFHSWMRSEVNPADSPSRRFEAKAARGKQQAESQAAAFAELLPLGGPVVEDSALFFIHLCSGPPRPGDLVEMVVACANAAGHHVVGIRVDPLASPPMDLLDPAASHRLRELGRLRRVIGAQGGPPCSTVSRVRHRPLQNGPRPLRSRADFWHCLPDRSKRENLACDIGSALLLLGVNLLAYLSSWGAWVCLEHPRGPGM